MAGKHFSQEYKERMVREQHKPTHMKPMTEVVDDKVHERIVMAENFAMSIGAGAMLDAAENFIQTLD